MAATADSSLIQNSSRAGRRQAQHTPILPPEMVQVPDREQGSEYFHPGFAGQIHRDRAGQDDGGGQYIEIVRLAVDVATISVVSVAEYREL